MDGPIGMSVACLGVMVNLVAIVVLARQRVQRTFHLLMIFLSGILSSGTFIKGIFNCKKTVCDLDPYFSMGFHVADLFRPALLHV